MTTKPKAHRFRIRRSTPNVAAGSELAAPREDGFGSRPFPGSAAAEAARPAGEAGIAEVRREGLTGRQLRIARRLAQKHGLEPTSDFDAVRLLRAKGIDPFDRSAMLELVAGRENSRDPARSDAPRGEAPLRTLPQKVESRETSLAPASPPPESPIRLHDVERIQRDIVRRRRRNLALLALRLMALVFLPTFAAFYYFAFVATPSYATKSEFVVQQAEMSAGPGGLLGGTALATSQDSIMVQDFLTSREAMLMLDDAHGYREHFSGAEVDVLQRIPEDASNEDVYRHYRNNVSLSYDQTEGVIRMEVSALSPEMSSTFSEALIDFAEERVDRVTERKRTDQMKGARETFDEAEANMVAAQERVLELQERLGVLDPASETTSVMTQVANFEGQLAEKRLQLRQLLDNERPNEARVAGVRGDISRLESLIADLRAQLTEQNDREGSLASVSARLRMAEVDLETRTMMMQEAMQQLEAARTEANRQVRFLSLGVAPIAPDEPTHPKVFENTLISLLLFSAIYLLLSLTVAVLREQVST